MIAEMEVELESIYKGDTMTVSSPEGILRVRAIPDALVDVHNSSPSPTRPSASPATVLALARRRTLSTAPSATAAVSVSSGINSVRASFNKFRCIATPVEVEVARSSTFARNAKVTELCRRRAS